MGLVLPIVLLLQAISGRPAEDDLEVPAVLTQPPALEPQVTPVQAPQAPVEPAPAPPPSPPPSPPPPDVVTGRPEPSLTGGLTGPLGLVISGYVQGQYQTSAASEDQLQQGGLPLNEDRFLVRRARIRVDRAWKWAATAIEIDGNTTRGPTFGLRRAEVAFVWRNPEANAPPYLRVTAGLSEIPFGYEITDSPRARWFMERSAGGLALFPGEPDLGVRVSGGVGFFRYSVAAQNGEPLDDRPGRANRELNAAKDLVGRVGVDTAVGSRLRVSGGASFLTGEGFHAGNDATKNATLWRDLNENGQIDNGEITAVPATAATPSLTFSRWAFGVDLQLAFETRFGKSRLYGEVFVAQNADRGLFGADPIATGTDARELGWYVAFVQDVTRWGVVGFRADYYDPNADFFDERGGKLIPASAAIRTYSPLVGLVLPDRLRLLVQYDAIVDNLARDAQGVPTDLKNDQLTLRLQGEL
ncbi:MAG: hypothetical protein KIT84_30195 [Labilithrix sp.]|nr:hypothetical protein [Labilithrix sp.]MCW5815336.1 hypothetical protein [Labilithrix sp.]